MTLYIYESHLGGFYCTNEKQDIESLYCEHCGDYDTYLGKAENAYDVADILRTKVELFNMGGYSMEYCTKFFNVRHEFCLYKRTSAYKNSDDASH